MSEVDVGKLRTQPSEIFEALVDGIEDYAIVMLDPDGFVLSWNSGAQRIKQYESNEILGRHFSCFYTEDDVANRVPELQLVEARRSVLAGLLGDWDPDRDSELGALVAKLSRELCGGDSDNPDRPERPGRDRPSSGDPSAEDPTAA